MHKSIISRGSVTNKSEKGMGKGWSLKNPPRIQVKQTVTNGITKIDTNLTYNLSKGTINMKMTFNTEQT